MRKIFLVLLILTSLIIACETKTPTGPGALTVVQTTTSTTTITTTTVGPTTTSTSTTTTTVVGSTSRRYMAFQPPPDIPADMTLFFELLLAPASASSPGTASVGGQANAEAENEYRVTGVYVMGNGTTGAIIGELGGSSNPLETGGTFEGIVTAKTTTGCTAEREFGGDLSGQRLEWGAGSVRSNTCGSINPLGFLLLTMFRVDGTPLPTTTIGPSTTTTTSVACTYSLSPPSASVSAAGGTVSVAITTPSGCAWSAQSFAPWITVQPPFGGTGPATVVLNVQPTTSARTGNALIAGIQFVVSQAAPVTTTTSTTSSSSSTTTTSIVPADLVPFDPSASGFCRTDTSGNLLVGVLNQGAGTAPVSVTRVVFSTSTTPVTTNMSTPSLAPKATTDVTFAIPAGCFNPDCSFTITVNATGVVTETSTANNTQGGRCLG